MEITYKWFDNLKSKGEYHEILTTCLQNIETTKTPYAYTCIGYLYEYGHGVKEDIKIAMKYYKIAKKLKDPLAYVRIGIICQTKKKYEKAIQYFKKAFEINGSSGACSMAEAYILGIGVEIDYMKAFEWIDKVDPSHDGLAFRLWRKGCIHRKMENYIDALNCFYQSKLEYTKLEKLSDIDDCIESIEDIFGNDDFYQKNFSDIMNFLIDKKIIKQMKDNKYDVMQIKFMKTLQVAYKIKNHVKINEIITNWCILDCILSLLTENNFFKNNKTEETIVPKQEEKYSNKNFDVDIVFI
ncbi:MAG: hypothetical protein Edafosvirus7_22 [Edafosvirus sp.]|uniref:Uncharacterized protein n=1 Tax=Edafosvirus sp. TaxID=2487765 RepID=A0A3G4ZTK9_9VIRU|nr:MAG: hypothetical protein Edafosvirus7_22 [Edafosvirus sp.]